MGVLLLLVGLLVICSGGLKHRERIRSLYGRSLLTTLETGAGAILVIGSGIGLSRTRTLAWVLVVIALGLSLASNRIHMRLITRHFRNREASEGKRLKEYLREREESK